MSNFLKNIDVLPVYSHTLRSANCTVTRRIRPSVRKQDEASFASLPHPGILALIPINGIRLNVGYA